MITQNMMWERLMKLGHFYVYIYMCIFNTQTKEDILPRENQNEAFPPRGVPLNLLSTPCLEKESVCPACLSCAGKP